MPVTIKVASHDALSVYIPAINNDTTSQQLLQSVAHKDTKDIGPILETREGMVQTSLTDERLKKMQMYPRDHGLIHGAFEAYSRHHNFVLRPEDIWFAILTQFSFYVNANSEKLREHFVAHEGKKGLVLEAPGESDMSLMCRNMTKLLDENVVDPELRTWILPSFTTTKVEDETIAAIIMMGTLQSYYEYVYDCSRCGIPAVTLLGEKEDWEDIARRLEKLEKYGEEPAEFSRLLKPILREMIACFDPDNTVGSEFWSRIVNYWGGSGKSKLTGWITCFAFWNEDGKVLAPSPGVMPFDRNLPERLRDVRGPFIDFDKIPCCFVSVPVLYITPDFERIETKILAGFAGFEATTAPSASLASSSASQELSTRSAAIATEKEPEEQAPRDTIRPVTAWWMFKVKNPKGTGSEGLQEFYEKKLANDWEGGVSVGEVKRDGTVQVRHGLYD